MVLTFSDERMPGKVVVEQMIKAGEKVALEEGLDPKRMEVSVTFVSEEEIRELNKIYRNKDAITDVLSFPQYGSSEEFPESGSVCVGDVVICPEQALIQADEYGHTGERELVYLFVHSLFHLLGYDHMEESNKQEMRLQEEKIMDIIGIGR